MPVTATPDQIINADMSALFALGKVRVAAANKESDLMNYARKYHTEMLRQNK